MSSGNAGQGAVYSPLPQSIIDSDTSEEELHTSIIHQANSVTFRKPNTSPRYSLNKSNGLNMGEYRPLGYDSEADRSVNGIGSIHQQSATRDNIRIIQSDSGMLTTQMKRMGPVRSFFFFLSIFLCFFTVVVFLWVLPCDWSLCPDVAHKSSIKSWERILTRLELKGSISVVPGLEGRGRNLVMMGRCKIVNDTSDANETGNECSNSEMDGGVISLVGSNGALAWWKPLRSLPREMDCSLMDFDGDGVPDCIVVGSKGLLAVINALSGMLIWNLHSVNDTLVRPVDLEFPILLPDLDGDGVNELVTSCSTTESSQANNLILVSGGSGVLMGLPFKMNGCVRVHGLNLNKFLNVSYICQDAAGRESMKLLSFKELYSMIMNQSNLNVKSLIGERPKQHESLGRTKQDNGATKTYSYNVNGRRLTLENRGRCPMHCGVTVRVMDQRPGAGNEMVWNYTAENMYAMVPATLLFNNRTLANGTILTEPISGFVLKFWQWNHVFLQDNNSSANPAFRNRLKRRNAYTSVHRLKERVVLITFNATDMHIVNASQNEVVQLCVHNTADEMNCQPDLQFQEQSLLIADLDQDRSQELVSYYTTYVSYGPDDVNGPWKLESKVRAIRLEAELPKLYEAVSRQ